MSVIKYSPYPPPAGIQTNPLEPIEIPQPTTTPLGPDQLTPLAQRRQPSLPPPTLSLGGSNVKPVKYGPRQLIEQMSATSTSGLAVGHMGGYHQSEEHIYEETHLSTPRNHLAQYVQSPFTQTFPRYPQPHPATTATLHSSPISPTHHLSELHIDTDQGSTDNDLFTTLTTPLPGYAPQTFFPSLPMSSVDPNPTTQHMFAVYSQPHLPQLALQLPTGGSTATLFGMGQPQSQEQGGVAPAEIFAGWALAVPSQSTPKSSTQDSSSGATRSRVFSTRSTADPENLSPVEPAIGTNTPRHAQLKTTSIQIGPTSRVSPDDLLTLYPIPDAFPSLSHSSPIAIPHPSSSTRSIPTPRPLPNPSPVRLPILAYAYSPDGLIVSPEAMTEHSTCTTSARSSQGQQSGWRFGMRHSDDERPMGEAGLGEVDESQKGSEEVQMEVEMEMEQANEPEEEMSIREASTRSESVCSGISERSIRSADTARPNTGVTAQTTGPGGQQSEERLQNWKCRLSDGLRAIRDLEEDLARYVGSSVDDWAEMIGRWFLPEARVKLLLTSEEKIKEFDMNALFLAPLFTAFQSSGLISQSLRITETSENLISFSSSNTFDQAEQGILLEADDFRWKFGYKGGMEVIWEGTFMATWIMGNAGTKVERMEWIVHEFTVIGGRRDKGEEEVVKGAGIGDWGVPDMVFDVLKMIETSEQFEPIRAEADKKEMGYDDALDILLSKVDPDELYFGESDSEAGDSEDEAIEEDIPMDRPEPDGNGVDPAPVDQDEGQGREKALDVEEEEDDLFDENVKLEE